MVTEVTVVIPTLNSSETIQECLSSVTRNAARYPFEVVVVDGGSRDGTIEIAQKFGARVIVKEGCPIGPSRNLGFQEGKGEIVCFTDSDCVVPPDWIETLVRQLQEGHARDRRIVGVGGGNLPDLPEKPSLAAEAIAEVVRSPLVSFRARNLSRDSQPREIDHNPPINSAYFRWVLSEAGGFGEDPRSSEDVVLDARITQLGYKLYYFPQPVVYHKHKTSFKKFIRQMHDFGSKRIRLGKEYPRYFQWHHFGPMFLCLMTFTPLVFIPLGMALVNALWVTTRRGNIALFFPAWFLTLSFYVSYGAGELKALWERRK